MAAEGNATAQTIVAALDAEGAGDPNPFVRDVNARAAGTDCDKDHAPWGMKVADGAGACWEHVHPNEWNVVDASYWIYLMHLPLTLFIPALFRNWDIDGTVKMFVMMVLVTMLRRRCRRRR